MNYSGDEAFRATSRLIDAAKVNPSAAPDQKALPAVNIAFDFPGSVFSWMSTPENAWRGKRLGEAMQQLHRMANQNVSDGTFIFCSLPTVLTSLLADYPWHELTSPIVDIGAGIGALEQGLLKDPRNDKLEFVLFDIPGTIENAKKVRSLDIFQHLSIDLTLCKKAWATHPAASRVSFAPGTFMAPSISETGVPLGKPTYIIRHVLHDWTDADVVKILSVAREAMSSHTGGARLLLVEMLLREESSRFVRTTSMQLLALNSGITRTQGEMEALVVKAGMKVNKVTHMRAVDSVIEAVIA